MVFASIVEFAAVSYIGHIRPSASSRRPNGTCGRRLPTRTLTTVMDGQGQRAPADADRRSAVVIVNRDAASERRHLTSRRHLSIPDTSIRSAPACSLYPIALLFAVRIATLTNKIAPQSDVKTGRTLTAFICSDSSRTCFMRITIACCAVPRYNCNSCSYI